MMDGPINIRLGFVGKADIPSGIKSKKLIYFVAREYLKSSISCKNYFLFVKITRRFAIVANIPKAIGDRDETSTPLPRGNKRPSQ